MAVRSNHPRTARLVDPGLPQVATLLSTPVPDPIAAVVAEAGGVTEEGELLQVTWWPGTSITARYRITVTGGDLAGTSTYVAVAGRIPKGAVEVEGDTGRVGVWRVPHDPALPGLAAALDHDRAEQLLQDLGGAGGPVQTRLVAYRPGRRAVVSVTGSSEGLYLKLVRPKAVEQLHRSHQALAEVLPVPASLGFSRDLGIIALQSVPGVTLRGVLEDPGLALPSPHDIVDLPRHIPPPTESSKAPSSLARLDDIGPLLKELTPEYAGRVDELAEAIGGEPGPAETPSHGDYYEAQLLVEDGALVGLLDVDTYGWGRAVEDAAGMLAHLSVWATMSRQPDRVRRLGAELIEIWDQVLDPVDLRRTAAAAVLALATGPFRVQTADWPHETAERIAIAEEWQASAQRAR